MKKSDSNRLPICRLLTLLLALVVVGTSCYQVNGASLLHDANWSGIVNKLKTSETNTDLTETGSTQVRKHLLFNHCSDRFVKVVRRGRKGVNARGKYKPEMKFSTVVFTSTPRGTIVMLGNDTSNYICIGRSGRPKTSAKKRKKGCEFKEEYSSDGAMQYRLADNDRTIYLGFNKDGRPLKGTNIYNKNKQNCFKFTKMPADPKRGCATIGNGPAVSYCGFYNKMYSKDKRKQAKPGVRKIRHSKSHKQRRNNMR